MMTQKETPHGSVVGWEAAEHMRLTTFVRPATGDVANWTGLWREVIGSDPDQSVSQPRQNLIQETGALDDAPGAALVMNANPERVDWILRPNPVGPTQDPPTLGNVENALESFNKAIRPWLARELDVTRMAFGTILMSPAPNVEAGYQRLSEFLPNLNPKGLQDVANFMYQINRLRESESVPSITINRLSKWSVAAFESVSITVSPSSVRAVGSVGSPSLMSALELDINTSPKPNELIPNNGISQLFHELVSLGLEIANRGDIP